MPKGKPNKRYTPEYKIKVVWDKQNNNLHYFLDGEYKMSTRCTVALDGSKIGFYADGPNVEFKNVRISDELELDGIECFFSRGLNTAWTIYGSENARVYKGQANSILLFS